MTDIDTRIAAAEAALREASERYRWTLAAHLKGGPNAPTLSAVVFAEYAVGDAEAALYQAQNDL